MFQQTLVQLQILLTMAPGLAVWLLLTPSAQPFLVQALAGGAGQVVSQPLALHRDGRGFTTALSERHSRIEAPRTRAVSLRRRTLIAFAGGSRAITRPISFPHAARAP